MVSGGYPLWRRRIRRSVGIGCVLVCAALIAGLPVYVRPQTDQLRHADAILILGGYGDHRYSYGLDLGLQGWAPNIVVSVPDEGDNPTAKRLCTDPPPRRLTLHCFAPDPSTTRGEGRKLRELASQYGWRTVIVVTFQPHLSRARFILEQCFDGEVVMAQSPEHIPGLRWAFEYIYQTAGYLRAALQPDC